MLPLFALGSTGLCQANSPRDKRDRRRRHRPGSCVILYDGLGTISCNPVVDLEAHEKDVRAVQAHECLHATALSSVSSRTDGINIAEYCEMRDGCLAR